MVSAGLDLGSVASKAVLMENGKVIHSIIRCTEGLNLQRGEDFLNHFLQEANYDRSAIQFIGATGYGRISASFADRVTSEIICHARGVNHLIPNARTVIDIGGQDTKAIKINREGEVIKFEMNDKCAAGTGRFLETMARALGIPLQKMGDRSFQSSHPCSISSVCTVFAESEIISLLAEGNRLEDIVAGLHLSVAKRVQSMVQRIGLDQEVVFTGGVAHNAGVHSALEKILAQKIVVPDSPQLTGALGAALLYQD